MLLLRLSEACGDNSALKEKNTQIRLAEYMQMTGLQQVDILRRAEPYCKKFGVKLSKPDLSQFCSGKITPKQDKLYILSLAMGVNVTWLMGYDVPMYLNEADLAEQGGKSFTQGIINDRDNCAINDFLSLSDTDKAIVIGMINRLKRNPETGV